MSDELNERVERGAAWLDAMYPEWWADIDLARLDLNDGCRCVLGQLYPHSEDLDESYWRAMDRFGGPRWAEQHGFNVLVGNRYNADAYARLDELWIALIKQRWESGVQS